MIAMFLLIDSTDGTLEMVKMDDTGVDERDEDLKSLRDFLRLMNGVFLGFLPVVSRLQRVPDELRVKHREVFSHDEFFDVL